MVKQIYSCEICEENYNSFEKAKKCEEKGLIGPDITPGLVFSLKKVSEGFLIIYHELNSEKHERKYEVEEFLVWKATICPTQHYNLSGPKLIKELETGVELSSNKEINNLNKLFKEKFMGTGFIRGSMLRYEIKDLHNNFNLEELASQR